MNRLYVPQLMRVKINLEPYELCQDYEKKIKTKLVDTYGNHCYQNGFIKKSSIEIIKIENGTREGSHLHGFMTFHVEFMALYCIPRKDVIIPCLIKSINRFGVLAYAYPIDIMIPRQLQTYDKTIDLLKDLYEGEYISVKIKDYTIERDRLVAVGVVAEVGLEPPNIKEIPLENIIDNIVNLDNLTLAFSKNKPEPNEQLGSSQQLNQLKRRITPYNIVQSGKRTIWETNVRGRTNKYELVDKYKKINLVIKYNYEQIYSVNSLYPVISRAYFKLWEILVDTDILSKMKNKEINILNLAEGPGGFIQCLLDFRNHQHKKEWYNDKYYAITVKQDPNIRVFSHSLDWEYKEGKDYFDMMNDRGYHIERSYGPSGDGNLINIANIQVPHEHLNNQKCFLITSDGAAFAGDDEFETQELDNAKLFCAEILTALHHQIDDGVFIIKIYDIYYDLTVQLICLLALYYKEIKITKPKTSRPANSEKYLVCIGFKGITKEDLSQLVDRFKTWIETDDKTKYLINFLTIATSNDLNFMGTIREFNKYVLDLQMEKINEGLEIVIKKLYEDETYVTETTNQQVLIGKEWCKKYNIPYVTETHR